MKIKSTCIAATLLVAMCSPTAIAQGPRAVVISSGSGNDLWDVDLSNGLFTERRLMGQNNLGGNTTGNPRLPYTIEMIDGRFFTYQGRYQTEGVQFYELLWEFDSSVNKSRLTGNVADPVDGDLDINSRVIEPFFTNTGTAEGDFALNPDTGVLYATTLIDLGQDNDLSGQTFSSDDVDQLFTIDPFTNEITIIGPLLPGGKWSGLSFDCDGRLWALEVSNDFLIELDPNTAAALQFIPLDTDIADPSPLGGNPSNKAGMDWDPITQTMYIVDGDNGQGAETLYSVNVDTGVVTIIGSTDMPYSVFDALGQPRPRGASTGIVIIAVDEVDISNHLNAFGMGDQATELAAPANSLDAFDVLQYLDNANYLNNGGCIN